jgi:hypothetical protein
MKGECPKCGDGVVTTLFPCANETPMRSLLRGRLKLICFQARHEFEVLLPIESKLRDQLLREAFPLSVHPS